MVNGQGGSTCSTAAVACGAWRHHVQMGCRAGVNESHTMQCRDA